MVPRLVKLFDFPGRGATQIYAGYTCSFAVSEVGRCLFAPTRLPRSHVQDFPPWDSCSPHRAHSHSVLDSISAMSI